MTKTTENDYLGGLVRIAQPLQGYRAGVDPVLLAASVPAKAGQSVLELGTGVGTAALCLAARVPGIRLCGLELQPDYAALAAQNARRNKAAFEVITGDLADLPAELKQRTFDHVIANPPYYDRTAGFAATDSGRETGRGEATPLSVWLKVAAKRVAPKGYLTFIHRAERLADLLRYLPEAMGSIQVQPFQAREGRESHLLILRARHSGRAKLRLHAPICMHEGAEHAKDADDYTPQIRNVLRFGGSLPMPD